MTDPISNERLVGALDNLRAHQRQLDADGCEVGVSREALNEVIRAFGELSRRQSPAGVDAPEIEDLIEQLLDAQQDINLAANERMDQSLCDASALIDKTEAMLRRILSCLSVEPAGVEPVAWRIGHQFDGDRTVWTYFDGSDEVATDKAQPLYASPPKAVTITDEMVEATVIEIATLYGNYIPGHGWSGFGPTPDQIAAALSSEAHNGQ